MSVQEHTAITRADAARFWTHVARVDHDDCWLWLGTPKDSGYGYMRVGDRWIGVHRLAYLLSIGPIPPGQCVLHTCDVRLCCRGGHFFLGTRTDNAADRDAKGRTSRGAQHAEAIRQAWARRRALHTNHVEHSSERCQTGG